MASKPRVLKQIWLGFLSGFKHLKQHFCVLVYLFLILGAIALLIYVFATGKGQTYPELYNFLSWNLVVISCLVFFVVCVAYDLWSECDAKRNESQQIEPIEQDVNNSYQPSVIEIKKTMKKNNEEVMLELLDITDV